MDKIQIIENLFTYILVYSYLLLPLFFLFSKSKKELPIALLAIYGVVFFLFLKFFFHLPESYRKIQQAIYTLLEYSFFAYLIWHSIQTKKIKRFIVLSSLVFIVFQFTYYAIAKRQQLDSVPIAVETIFLFVFAFLYFQQFFKHNLNLNIYEYASFWLVVGILLYLGSSFFFNILANHVSKDQIDQYWHFTYIPEILKNILFALVVFGYFFKKSELAKTKYTDIPNLDMI